ncbi:20S proteasome subunit beta 4 [Fonticula alba]|uniref:Proteasome subunit beta n=1 Tax=Fonticula alba TaxID=691883 RepID=A0A058ZGQ3_FONAL|nr:20S proteasome subunit beta 4 [Fonticula alba]KCV73146.1 20S proteasome subunit beta 4 [Fonticula alba]|eukprot:XP_009492847.1 20S proteasome subunit beta 4 [Fonticula alba]
METLISLTGKDYVLTASDMTAARSILVFKVNEDKTRDLSPHITMAFCGESGDTVQFAEFIQKNIRLYAIRNNFELSPKAAANYVRTQLAESLRSRSPYAVNVLIAGFDEHEGPELYWLDYLGTLCKIPFGAHGFASNFVLSTLDNAYLPDMDLEQGIALLKSAIKVVQQRMLISQPNFQIKLVNKDGVSVIDI